MTVVTGLKPEALRGEGEGRGSWGDPAPTVNLEELRQRALATFGAQGHSIRLAEEAVQDAFLKLCADDGLVPIEAEAAFLQLMAAAWGFYGNMKRRESRWWSLTVPLLSDPLAREEPEPAADPAHVRAAIGRTLRTLSGGEMQVLSRMVVGGRSKLEVAAELGITRGGVDQHIHRMRKKHHRACRDQAWSRKSRLMGRRCLVKESGDFVS